MGKFYNKLLSYLRPQTYKHNDDTDVVSLQQKKYGLLIRQGKLTSEQLKAYCLQSMHEMLNLTSLLIHDAKIPVLDVGAALADYYQVPFMTFDPNNETCLELIHSFKLNIDYLSHQCWLPVSGNVNDEVVILIDDPNDKEKIEIISKVFKTQKLSFRVGFAEDILRYLRKGGTPFLHLLIARMNMEDELNMDDKKYATIKQQNTVEFNENDTIIVTLANRLLVEAHSAGTTEILFQMINNYGTIRWSIDGLFRHVSEIPLSFCPILLQRLLVMAKINPLPEQTPRIQEGEIDIYFKGEPLRYHVTLLPLTDGFTLVLRHIAMHYFPKALLHPPLERIGIHPGLWVISGPAESGKTTLLANLIQNLNTINRRILVISPRREFPFPGVCHYSNRALQGGDPDAGLHALLHRGPAIDLLVWEGVVDEHSLSLLVETALRGGIVLLSMEARSAVSTLAMMRQMMIKVEALTAALAGILHQRLLLQLCDHCQETVDLTSDQHQSIKAILNLHGVQSKEVLPNTLNYAGGGCHWCHYGIRGRVAVQEWLPFTAHLGHALIDGKNLTTLRTQAILVGMRPMVSDAWEKLRSGVIDYGTFLSMAAAVPALELADGEP
ncbi:MAG: Flp pilus assembly complex ATPase component TadA [Magnetococcus sp. YQC-5]